MKILHLEELPLKRLLKVVYWMLALVCTGTVGYRIIEDWSVCDSFFMTVITISTVGYGEPHTLSDTGRWFTSGLIFVSLISMTGWTAILTSFIVECNLGGNFLRRRTRKMIAAMKGHTVICGGGAMAQAVVERLMHKRSEVVLVDEDPQWLDSMKKRFRKLQTIEGNPCSELSLAQANVLNARHVIAATESEVNNLLIGITCKDIGPDVRVIAESNDMSIANRMRKSGIDEVVSPVMLGGDRVTQLVTQ